MTYALIFLLVTFIFFIIYLINIGAKGEHFGKAAVETVVVWVISNMPIGFLFMAAKYNEDENRFKKLIIGMLNGGEVFIYVSAILAPVVWALIAYFRESHRVLTGLYIMSLIIILPFSAFFFQQARLAGNHNSSMLNISAMLLYFASIILWYGATVYTRFVESYEPTTPGNPVLNDLQGGR